MKPVAFFLAALTAMIAGGSRPAAAQTLSPDQIRSIASRAYIFAYPMVLMEYTRRNAVGPNGAGENRLANAPAFPQAGPSNVIRPNADTLYSSSWLNLAKEPVMLHVPDTQDRYYMMQFMDAWTETFSVPGKRTTGTKEGWFALVGPGWTGHLPEGAQRIDAPTNTVWLIGRTQTNGPSDYENVHAIQRGYKLMPLSHYPDGVPPVAPGIGRRVAGVEMTPPKQIARLGAAEFFTLFAGLLTANPAHPADAPTMQDLARIGIVPGKFDPSIVDATAAGKEAFEAGVQEATGRLNGSGGGPRRIARSGANGWSGGLSDGTTAVGKYGTNYASRAAVARGGLGANPPEDAIYMSCAQDSTGEALDGSHKYRIHFDKGNLPPVRAFWSITMYGSDGFFIANPINRFAIGDRDPLKFNADGSLDLYVSQSAPESTLSSNWLPAPAGVFNLTLRLYWPMDAALSGKWVPASVIRQ
ncbi:MAG TPA: DUF1254 domain-containing protein [Bryobacteraceae bacterium]|jgi:hypothetical protein|nr:DUF1254 domain-containing protein [Bryobacteraceae bacterium]